MFNFQTALRPWDGQHLTIAEFMQALSDLRLEHLGELAPETGVQELLTLAVVQKWVVQEANGNLLVQVPEAVAV